MLWDLAVVSRLLTPLNNVDSIGVDSERVVHFSSPKATWNLGMQALGAARALSCDGRYAP
jgi:hypothetical protein